MLANPRIELGRPPADLVELVAQMALAGPAVTALRAIDRITEGLSTARDLLCRQLAVFAAKPVSTNRLTRFPERVGERQQRTLFLSGSTAEQFREIGPSPAPEQGCQPDRDRSLRD